MSDNIHPYYIVEEICKELGYAVKLMAGSSDNWTTFSVVRNDGDGLWPARIMHGSCFKTNVVVGIGQANRKDFDLNDPNSISELTEYIKTFIPWRVPSR